jgi:hypothetical protein
VFAGANNEHDRQIVVEVGGQQLIADVGANNGKAFDAFLPLAEEVLADVPSIRDVILFPHHRPES